MDFKNDIKEQLCKILEYYEVEFDKNDDLLGILISYLNFANRLISINSRKVHISRQLESKCDNDNDLHEIIEKFKKQFEDGDNMNGYLSRAIHHSNISTVERIEYSKARDYLLDDWGIHHLHLSNTKANTKDEMKNNRSDKLLFLVIRDSDVYFIDVLNHNDKNIFQQKGLLEIIENNWSFIIDKYCLNGVKEIELKIEDPKMIAKLRKIGMNVAYEINGKVYTSIGGGLTTSGTNTMHTVNSQKLIKRIDEIEDYYKSNNSNLNLRMSIIENNKLCVQDLVTGESFLHSIT
ncbi:MAG: hypothetical protein E6971_14405 [Clostridium perfringens]|nr:hypothetical protein [Clostridium perfringens]